MESVPSPEDFFLKASLYAVYTFGDPEEAYRLIRFTGPLDSWCLDCQQTSIFGALGANQRPRQPMIHPGNRDIGAIAEEAMLQQRDIHEIRLYCRRNVAHTLFFTILVAWQANTLMKVGQYPSLADLATTEIGKYRKILGSVYSEFNRAIGLYAHGVGIGAFVYLRRILEGLIERARQAAQGTDGWDESTYMGARLDEKIRLLAGSLPPFLVENRSVYAILSKGIHELSEQECLAAFPVVRLGIELILDQTLEQQERDAKTEEARKAIAALTGQLKDKRP
jgi:hypothetical protein